VAVAGPVLFTLDWWLLGWSHHGFQWRTETISSLTAHNAPAWPVMSVGQVALTAAFLAVGALTVLALGWRRGAAMVVFLVLAALGTIQLTIFRTICNHTDTGWCQKQPRSAYGHEQWLHGIGTGIAFAALQLAVLACAVTTWTVPGLGSLARASVAAEVVALPFTLWFLANAYTTWHGFTEKVFLTTLAAWTAYAGLRLAAVAERVAVPTST
jgi:hypothetical protein